jgi:uncharacterized protein YebE (UPF0316 family)
MFIDFGTLEQYVTFLIFFARVADVSLGTLRTLYVNAGLKLLAALAGFFQMLVWVFAVAGLVNDLNDYVRIFLFASGFSVGTILGIWIEEKIALGFRAIRIMNHSDDVSLAPLLRNHGYNVTQMDAQGYSNKVEVIIAILSRKEIKGFIQLVKESTSDVYYTIEKVGTPHRSNEKNNNWFSKFNFFNLLK